MQVKLISITQTPILNTMLDVVPPRPMTPEQLIIYIARVSNPENQNNTLTAPKLMAYLLRVKHWSPFEMVDFTVEIKTSRAIAAQILRHRSFSFQEFSQRYAVATEFEPIEVRKQGETNRQGGEEVFDPEIMIDGETDKASVLIKSYVELGEELYKGLIEGGVAKESARFVLPLSTQTTLYMKGSVRSWIHYLQQRCDAHAQKEHRQVAEQILSIFAQEFPNIYQGVFVNEE